MGFMCVRETSPQAKQGVSAVIANMTQKLLFCRQRAFVETDIGSGFKKSSENLSLLTFQTEKWESEKKSRIFW